MTEKTTPLDLTALHQHMLRQMGVGLWASQKGRVYDLPPVVADRFSASAGFWREQAPKNAGEQMEVVSDLKSGGAEGAFGGGLTSTIKISNQPIAQNSSQLIDDQATDGSSLIGQMPAKGLSSAIQGGHSADFGGVRPAINTPKYLQGLSVKEAAFEYWGLRYGAWLLLVDASHMDTAARGVWQSLAEALKKQSDKTVALRLKYPLVVNDYPEYQHYEQGHHALLGFFLRLCADGVGQDEPPFSVLCLTPLSERVDFGELLVYKKDAPSLRQMWETPEYKKQLWQMLHAVV